MCFVRRAYAHVAGKAHVHHRCAVLCHCTTRTFAIRPGSRAWSIIAQLVKIFHSLVVVVVCAASIVCRAKRPEVLWALFIEKVPRGSPSTALHLACASRPAGHGPIGTTAPEVTYETCTCFAGFQAALQRLNYIIRPLHQDPPGCT